MKIYKNTMSESQLKAFARNFLDRRMLLLDIETTGLSPAKNFIYCIGCSFIENEDITIQLLFAGNETDEPQLLEQLSVLLGTRTTVITFNGTTFDLPFLKKRYARYEMADPFRQCDFLDLYREARQLKRLLRLESYKQKSLEQFLGCVRKDTYSGGKLIDIYLKYVNDPNPESLKLLLTHNYEDVKGMYDLIEILAYRNFLDGHFQIQDIIPENDSGNAMLNFILTPESPLPQSIHLLTKDAKVILDRERALLQFPVHTGKLRHYFTDYRNYYYLPEENTVIHKSVGAYVDASHRQKATRENCFLEKDCAYLALSVPDKNSYLKKDFSDQHTYLELPGFSVGGTYPARELTQENDSRFYDYLLLFLNTLK